MGVRRDQDLRAPAARQVGLERIGIDRVVEDEQDALALVPQPLHHRGERRLLLLVGGDPPEPHAEPDEIGAHRGLGLRPDPPRRPVVAAMPLRVGGRQRGLADAAQPVQRRDGDAALVALERRLDRCQRVVAAQEMRRHPDRDVGDGEPLPGNANAAGASRFSMNSRKRMRAASSGMP